MFTFQASNWGGACAIHSEENDKKYLLFSWWNEVGSKKKTPACQQHLTAQKKPYNILKKN